MTLLSSLTTRFKDRLGLTTLSTVGVAQVEEAITAAVARLASDGMPGLGTLNYTGEISGSASITVSAHSAGDSTITFTGGTISALPVRLFPGDIVKLSDGTYREIYATPVEDGSLATNEYSFGSPILTAQTGSLTVYQRCIQQPTCGSVLRMYDQDTEAVLTSDNNALTSFGLAPNSYAPTRYEQRVSYDASDGTVIGYIVIWPNQTSAAQFGIRQQKSFDQLTDASGGYGAEDVVPWPDETIDAVLAKAIQIWRFWRVGGVSPIEENASTREVRDTAEAVNIATSSAPIKRRPSR